MNKLNQILLGSTFVGVLGLSGNVDGAALGNTNAQGNRAHKSQIEGEACNNPLKKYPSVTETDLISERYEWVERRSNERVTDHSDNITQGFRYAFSNNYFADLDNDKLVVMVQGQDIEKTVRTEKVSWDRERIMIREYKDYIYECEAVSSHNFQVGRDQNNSYQMTSSVFAYVLNNTKSRTNREDLPDRTENEIREVELEPKILSSSPAPGIEIAVSAKASILFPEGLDRTYTSDNEGAIEIDMNIGYPHIISESISDMSLDNVNLSWLPSSQRQRALNYIKTQTQRETVELSLEAQGLEVEGGDYSIGLLVCPEKDVVKEYLGE